MVRAPVDVETSTARRGGGYFFLVAGSFEGVVAAGVGAARFGFGCPTPKYDPTEGPRPGLGLLRLGLVGVAVGLRRLPLRWRVSLGRFTW